MESWKDSTLDPVVTEVCLITGRFLHPGRIYGEKCYDNSWPDEKIFFQDIHVIWNNDEISYYQITYGISFAFGCTLNQGKVYKIENGKEKLKFCFYIICIHAAEYIDEHKYLDIAYGNLIDNEENYTYINIARYLDNEIFFDKNASIPSAVNDWAKEYQKIYKSVAYTPDFQKIGKY